MKRLLVAALLSASCFSVQSEIRDCSVTNLPTTFAGVGAIALSGVQTRGFVAYNDSSTDIRICFTSGSAASCVDAKSFPLPAGATATQEFYPVGSNVFVRAVGSACTTGEIFIAAGVSQ